MISPALLSSDDNNNFGFTFSIFFGRLYKKSDLVVMLKLNSVSTPNFFPVDEGTLFATYGNMA